MTVPETTDNPDMTEQDLAAATAHAMKARIRAELGEEEHKAHREAEARDGQRAFRSAVLLGGVLGAETVILLAMLLRLVEVLW